MNSKTVKRLKRCADELVLSQMERGDENFTTASKRMYKSLKKSYTEKRIRFKDV